MTITLPPFVCGVIVTIGAELVALIIAGIVKTVKKNKQRKPLYRK
jgi:hypothetical protein